MIHVGEPVCPPLLKSKNFGFAAIISVVQLYENFYSGLLRHEVLVTTATTRDYQRRILSRPGRTWCMVLE